MKRMPIILLIAAMLALSGCAGGLKPTDRSKTVGQEKQTIAERSAKTKAAMSSYTTKAAPVGADTLLISDSQASNATKKASISTMRAALGLGTSDNPAFSSVMSSTGNILMANTQVTGKWITGLGYTADVTSVIHGGKHWICTSSHTAGSTTEPGVGASYGTVWEESGGAGDDLGSAAYTDVVALWTTCTGYLKSDGSCDVPSGTYTSEIGQDMAGAMVTGNTETGISVTYDDADGTLDFVVGNIPGTAAGITGITLPAPTASGQSWASTGAGVMELVTDTTASSIGTSIVTAETAAAVRGLLDVEPGTDVQAPLVSGTNIKTINNTSLLGSGNISISGSGTVTVQSADPTSASAEGWYAATGSGDIFYKSSAGLFTVAGSYAADPTTYTLALDGTGWNGTDAVTVGATTLTADGSFTGLSSATTAVTCTPDTGRTCSCTGAEVTGSAPNYVVDMSDSNESMACTFAAGVTDTLYDAQVVFADGVQVGSAFKICAYDRTNSGALVECSSPGTVTNNSIQTAMFAGTISLIAGHNYTLGIIANGAVAVAKADTSDATFYLAGSYSSPPSSTTGEAWTAGDTLSLVVRNSSGTVLIGSLASPINAQNLNSNTLYLWNNYETY